MKNIIKNLVVLSAVVAVIVIGTYYLPIGTTKVTIPEKSLATPVHSLTATEFFDIKLGEYKKSDSYQSLQKDAWDNFNKMVEKEKKDLDKELDGIARDNVRNAIFHRLQEIDVTGTTTQLSVKK